MSPPQPVAARGVGLAAAFQVCPGGVVTVLGIIWHSFPWERVVRCCVPPQFSLVSPHTTFPPLPTSTPSLAQLPLPQHSRWGGHAVGLGEEEEAGVALALARSAIFHHTANETTRSSPQFTEAAWQGPGGSSPCLWGPGLALYNTETTETGVQGWV